MSGAPDVRTPGGNPANAEDTKADTEHFATAATDLQVAQRKRFESLRAVLAMQGYELHANEDGTFTVRRWGGLTIDLNGLDAVEDFVRAVGAVE